MLCRCSKYESGLKKINMHVVKVGNILLPHMQKYRKVLAACIKAKVFGRESKTNNGHTVAVLCQRHDFVLLYHLFFIFLLFN